MGTPFTEARLLQARLRGSDSCSVRSDQLRIPRPYAQPWDTAFIVHDEGCLKRFGRAGGGSSLSMMDRRQARRARSLSENAEQLSELLVMLPGSIAPNDIKERVADYLQRAKEARFEAARSNMTDEIREGFVKVADEYERMAAALGKTSLTS
jgi:hypothetical protein